MPVIEYGPPGVRGVTQIMGLGQTEYMEPAEMDAAAAIRNVGRFSAILWITGLVMSNSRLKDVGLGGLLSAIAVSQATKIPGSHPVLTLLPRR
jgi:hypothetical protein